MGLTCVDSYEDGICLLTTNVCSERLVIDCFKRAENVVSEADGSFFSSKEEFGCFSAEEELGCFSSEVVCSRFGSDVEASILRLNPETGVEVYSVECVLAFFDTEPEGRSSRSSFRVRPSSGGPKAFCDFLNCLW
ncbi:hypothetical protein NDU88_004090 [Pleurodeles waltl]|uniref:Uncharacterized protein n=1 Tax=Pleurodeles waltl TaxID=8319 RepID=A0AAV7MUG9_PLEWA|nr:hypothetical protein NDU88_004090 [Pleurodeles waltl]